MVVAYKKLNFANILVSNAKKIEFKINLLFYDYSYAAGLPENCGIGRRHFRLKQTQLTE